MHPDVRQLTVNVLYRDDALVIVDKPAGMIVHRCEGARDPVVVMTFVRDLVGAHVFPVHRLDRATSGVMAVALTAEAARRMNALFQKRLVRKTYVAVVSGCAADSGRIDVPVDGKSAVTDYLCLARNAAASLLRVHPLNGRRHQIRRHFQGVGMPILGDRIYGDENSYPRLALHALRLAFPHPIGGEMLDITSPLPDGFVSGEFQAALLSSRDKGSYVEDR